MKTKTVTLTAKQIKALERAWAVLHYGYKPTFENGFDPVKRNEKRDRSAAEVIHEILGDPDGDE